jgi:lipopolysaccharide/colanic/teichoic acid biosynthesis glycosyltransferase
MDAALAVALLVLTAPLMLVAAALVRLTSRGPAIYTQERLGLGGQPFTIYKIRTMYRDSEALTGARWSTPGDPRVTLVGWILRATHVDELPQLVNVLRGEMSLVGPRPERPEIVASLQHQLPAYAERLRVLPGITGLAQVQLPPDVDVESVRRKLSCDLYYIEHVGPWLDLRIMVATAIGALGLPSPVSRALLRLPSSETIESAPSGLPAASDVAAVRIEPASRATFERFHLAVCDVAERPDRHLAGGTSAPPPGVEAMPQIHPA